MDIDIENVRVMVNLLRKTIMDYYNFDRNVSITVIRGDYVDQINLLFLKENHVLFHNFLNIEFVGMFDMSINYSSFGISTYCSVSDFIELFYTKVNIRSFHLKELLS